MSSRLLAAAIDVQIDREVVLVRGIDQKNNRRFEALHLMQIHETHRIRARRIDIQLLDVRLDLQQLRQLLDDRRQRFSARRRVPRNRQRQQQIAASRSRTLPRRRQRQKAEAIKQTGDGRGGRMLPRIFDRFNNDAHSLPDPLVRPRGYLLERRESSAGANEAIQRVVIRTVQRTSQECNS